MPVLFGTYRRSRWTRHIRATLQVESCSAAFAKLGLGNLLSAGYHKCSISRFDRRPSNLQVFGLQQRTPSVRDIITGKLHVLASVRNPSPNAHRYVALGLHP